jgi:nitroimidazol reductase NimA-like FMN-containing flavoprotein (pyridoxamine 5'-phosphate oxidase superfamily)
VAELLDLPDGYGRATRMLAWATVSAMLEESRQYWLATVRAGNRPHVVPLDGIWLDDVWYYGGSPDTVHAQAVLANPHAVLHLPDPWKVVVVEGEVRRVTPDDATAQRLADLSSVKYPDYGIDYTPDLYAEVSAFRPVHAVAWTSFPQDATRFRWSA